jgi:hypothetical protein
MPSAPCNICLWAREETTIGHVVVCLVLNDIICRCAIYISNGDKKEFTKLISISMGKPLIVRDRSGLLTIITMIIRDEISNGFCVIILLWSSFHTCTLSTI